MPKLWTQTVEAHRGEVRDAILTAAGELVRSRGLLGVSMSQIAEAAGIGRATLYKYFPDVEQVVAAWHDRQVAEHLAQLADIREQPGDSAERLRAVLAAYGRICQQRRQHGADVTAALHRDGPADDRQAQLIAIVAGLLTEAAAAGAVRRDVPPDELAAYCISALEAAGTIRTPAGMARLVDVVWAGVVAPRPPGASTRSARRRPA
jgi:AcrR family transcriptional regulator